jgi:hypothetical protein
MYLDPFVGFIGSGKFMVFLQSYFDESGKVAQHDIASFCGFVATSDQWKQCWYAWIELLREMQLKELKASDVLRYRRPLSKAVSAIGIDARTSVLTPFVKAIRENVSFGVAVTIDCKAYKQLPEADRAVLRQEPHYWAFQQALVIIKHYAEVGFNSHAPDIQISLSCDEEEKTAIECLKIFINLRMRYPELRERFVGFGIADDKYFPQLQAADFLASLARQAAAQRFHNTPFDMNPLYELLTSPAPKMTPVVSLFMERDLLIGLAKAERQGRKKRGKT